MNSTKALHRKFFSTIFTLLFLIPAFAQPFNKDDVNDLDRLFMQPYNKTLDLAGDVLTATTMAFPLVLAATSSDQWLTEAVMGAESFLLALGIEETGKHFVNRTRPYMYFPNFPQNEYDDGDYLNAWPSAHTTMAFTSAAFTTYVFSSYFPESPWRFAVAGGAYTLAVTTAALRMASGNHFLTDVLSGAAIGTTCGLLIPYLHTIIAKKMPESDTLQIQATPFSLLVRLNF